MTKVEEDTGVERLEDIFNEPHCESTHTHPDNRVCSHQVVATQISGCGCSWLACSAQVGFVMRMKKAAIRLFLCVRCGRMTPSDDFRTIPRG